MDVIIQMERKEETGLFDNRRRIHALRLKINWALIVSERLLTYLYDKLFDFILQIIKCGCGRGCGRREGIGWIQHCFYVKITSFGPLFTPLSNPSLPFIITINAIFWIAAILLIAVHGFVCFLHACLSPRDAITNHEVQKLLKKVFIL